MRRVFVPALILLAGCASASDEFGSQQSNPCSPKLASRHSKGVDRHPLKGNFKGYKRSPLVTFEVDESGTIRNPKIKRSSGSPTADQLAVEWVREWKYKPLPGCGIVESEVMVIIDFTSQ